LSLASLSLFSEYSFSEAEKIFGSPTTPNQIKAATAIQHLALFIMPALIISQTLSSEAHRYLFLNKIPEQRLCIIAILLMLISIPLINLLGELNVYIIDAILGKENVFKEALSMYEKMANKLIVAHSTTDVIINTIVIALIPAISEELIFRALFIRFFSKFTNIHIAILISAILFGLVHLEFYGLIPRVAFGVLFGYLFIWSKNILIPIIAHFTNNFIIVITINYFGEEYIQSSNISNNIYITIIAGIISAAILTFILFSLSKKYETVDIFRNKKLHFEKATIKKWFTDPS